MEFTAFTMCLTFVWFPSVNDVEHSVSIVNFPSIKAVEGNKEELSASFPVILALAVGTKDCDWLACLSKDYNKSRHSSFVWDPSSFYTKAQKFHL